MPTIRDGKKYFTRDELEKRLDDYIEQSADDMIMELRAKRESTVTNESTQYV